MKEQEIGTQKKTVTFEAPDQGLIEAESKNSEQENLSEKPDTEGIGYVDGQDQVDNVLFGECRWMVDHLHRKLHQSYAPRQTHLIHF